MNRYRTSRRQRCASATIVRNCVNNLAWLLALGILLAGGAQAAEHRFQLLLDTDNATSTGCSVATAGGAVNGIEQVWTTVVTTSGTGAVVTRIERQTCAGSTLGVASVYSAAGWSAGIGNGTQGTAAIETFVPMSVLPAFVNVRVVVIGINATGGRDATGPFIVSLAQPPSTVAQPIPLSPWLVLPLAIALMAGLGYVHRRNPAHWSILAFALLVAASAAVWAASVNLDGNVGDWAGIAPVAGNAKGSAPVDANIVAVFYQSDASNLYFRIDADVRADLLGNQAPVVSAGTDQTIGLAAAAQLAGSVSDDGLPNPPAALTIAWSKLSGPGTVTFGNAQSANTSASFSQAGTYVLRLAANDGALTSTDDTQIIVTAAGNRNPVTQADSLQTAPGSAAQVNVLANDSDADGDTLSVTAFTQGAHGTVACGGGGACTYTPAAGFSGADAFAYTVSDGRGGTATGNVSVTVSSSGMLVPPTVDTSVSSAVGAITAFLYAGTNPVQTGVAVGAIQNARAAVVRGKVLTRDGAALANVRISILNHPEFGQTQSRSDGAYDMAVNGGGLVTVTFAATGFLSAQKQVDVPWQDFVVVPDTALVPLDTRMTTIAANAGTMQVHQASVVTDSDGTRRATLLFPAATTASMVLPDNSTQALATLSVRATEYTVGSNGKRAMPGPLPSTSAYTYAVEFSADEAIAAGARTVTFNQPVIEYVDNFLNFPVGVNVPTGFYDPQRTAWVPLPNGLVIKIVSITAGLADVDSDGDGIADTALGMSSDERQNLASLYSIGKTLWRVPIAHFSVVDNNWGFVPADTSTPDQHHAGPDRDNPPDDPSTCEGCVIDMENQALGETVPIVGTPYTLNYRSDRQPGHVLAKGITLSDGSTLSPNLAAIELHVSVAGRAFDQTFAPTPNQHTTFTWDRRDAYGRVLQGGQPLSGSIDYVYPASYMRSGASPAFAVPVGAVMLENPTRAQFAISKPISAVVGQGLTDARAIGLGGWTLSTHHFFDPVARVLQTGDGRYRSAESSGRVIQNVISAPKRPLVNSLFGDVTVAPDGSVYFYRAADSIGVHQVLKRLAPDGTETLFAGGGTSVTPPFGDEGPATAASQLEGPIALGPDGSVYVLSDGNVIRRITPDGIIHLFAGRYQTGFGIICSAAPDNVPATATDLCAGTFAVGPDGSLYLAENDFGGPFTAGVARIRRVGPDGFIRTVAGSTSSCSPFDLDCDDGAPALGARLTSAGPIAVGPDGTYYFKDFNRLKKVGADGLIHTVTINNSLVLNVQTFSIAPDGTLYGGAIDRSQVVKINPDGTVAAIAGSGAFTVSGDGGPALKAGLGNIGGVAFAPDGTVFVTSITNQTGTSLRRVGSFLPGVSSTDFSIPSEDGLELYVFDASGRHLRTLNALTGATLREFGYDAAGLLASVAEKTGGIDNVTTIQHDGSGRPTSITGPYGQVTRLTADGNGFLASVANPAGETVHLSADANGLLTSYADARGKTSTYSYDAGGLLTQTIEPDGGRRTFARTSGPSQSMVTDTTALGRVSTYSTATSIANVLHRVFVEPDGTQIVVDDNLDAATRTTTDSTGIVSTTQRDGDPRYGMGAPVATALHVVSPGGLTLDATSTVTASLTNSADPFTLTSLTMTGTVNNRATTASYTASTRTLVSTSPVGRTAAVTIDALGRKVSTQLAGLAATAFTYDNRGRKATMVEGTGPGARTTTFAYNNEGYLSAVTDAIGRTAHFSYDAAGRLIGKTYADGRSVAFAYDAAGNMTSLTAPGRPAHTFTYSDRDQLTGVVPPAVSGTGPSTYGYDLDEQPTGVTRPDGRAVALIYDSSGRTVSRSFVTGGVATGADTRTYDNAGRVASITSASGITTTRAYDGPLVTGITWSGQISGSVTRVYDGNFRMTSESVNGANSVSVAYDDDDLLASVDGLVLARDAQSGLPVGGTLGVVTTAIGYSPFGEVTSYGATASGGALLSDTITRDALGRVAAKSETIAGVTDAYAYTYETSGQLIGVSKNGVPTELYSYDSNGNRASATVAGVPITASYDAQDRLVQYGSTTFTYSAAGDLQSKATGGQTTTYSYDALGNLLAVNLPTGTVVSYVVDGSNRRMVKKVNGTFARGFLYSDDLRPAAEIDSSGAVVSRFAYIASNAPVSMTKGGVKFRILTDQVGSVRLVVNTVTGAIAQRIDYDSFGNVIVDSNPGFQPFGFAGGLYDPETGLVRFGTRDYDASVGRWSTKDRVGFGGGDGNLYRYVRNDPVDLRDPSGEASNFSRKPPSEQLALLAEYLDKNKNAEREIPRDASPDVVEEITKANAKLLDYESKALTMIERLLRNRQAAADGAGGYGNPCKKLRAFEFLQFWEPIKMGLQYLKTGKEPTVQDLLEDLLYGHSLPDDVRQAQQIEGIEA